MRCIKIAYYKIFMHLSRNSFDFRWNGLQIIVNFWKEQTEQMEQMKNCNLFHLKRRLYGDLTIMEQMEQTYI